MSAPSNIASRRKPGANLSISMPGKHKGHKAFRRSSAPTTPTPDWVHSARAEYFKLNSYESAKSRKQAERGHTPDRFLTLSADTLGAVSAPTPPRSPFSPTFTLRPPTPQSAPATHWQPSPIAHMNKAATDAGDVPGAQSRWAHAMQVMGYVIDCLLAVLVSAIMQALYSMGKDTSR